MKVSSFVASQVKTTVNCDPLCQASKSLTVYKWICPSKTWAQTHNCGNTASFLLVLHIYSIYLPLLKSYFILLNEEVLIVTLDGDNWRITCSNFILKLYIIDKLSYSFQIYFIW